MARRRANGFNSPFSQLRDKDVARPSTLARKPRPNGSSVCTLGSPCVPTTPQEREAVTDEQAFMQAVAGCTPRSAGAGRIVQRPEAMLPGPTDEERALLELEDMVRGVGRLEAHQSEEVLYWAAPGVNHALLAALERGHFATHTHLDLHGMTRDEAHSAVARFVAVSRREGASCVLIITGRGKKSPGGLSVLREALPRWLSRAPVRPHVLAFCTARNADGGPGAFYVLLRRCGVAPFGTTA